MYEAWNLMLLPALELAVWTILDLLPIHGGVK